MTQPKTRAEAAAQREAAAVPNRWIPSPAARRWLYGVLTAAGPLVVFYGLMTAQEVVLWLGLGATILGTPVGALASANTPK